MKVLYVGTSKSIIKNLKELGAEVVSSKEGIDGIVITKDITLNEIEELRGLKLPIILGSGKTELQRNIDVLVLDEDEMNIFCGTSKWDIPQCKEKIRKLGIKHLVVSLSKKEVQQRIVFYYLPQINVKEVKITDEEVERAKDVITAIIGYIYIKEGLLMPESLERAKVGAMLELVEAKKAEGYHLKFNLKRRK